MAKLAITILVLRVLQLALAFVFIVFWAWSCGAHYVVGGGAGEQFFGFLTGLASLAISAHGIWSFVRKQHLADHSSLYHNARWATDLAVTALWVGVIVVAIVAPISPGGVYSNDPSVNPPSASAPMQVAEMGYSITELFSAITFMLTALLLVVPAVKARGSRAGLEDRRKGTAAGTVAQA